MKEAHESCDGCKHDLGGGRDNCRLNLAYECRDGGGFELWEANEDEPDHEPEREAHSTAFLIFFAATCALIGAVIYKWVVALL